MRLVRVVLPSHQELLEENDEVPPLRLAAGVRTIPGGAMSFDYPEETRGSLIARELSARCNSLSGEQREECLRRAASMIDAPGSPDAIIDLSLVVVATRDTKGVWRVGCGPAVAEIVPKGDPYGADELHLPRLGLTIQRALSEAVALVLIEEKFVRAESRKGPGPSQGDNGS